jgi:L-rhamnose mutarotase
VSVRKWIALLYHNDSSFRKPRSKEKQSVETGQTQTHIDYLSSSEVNQRWGEWMGPIMKIKIDSNTDFPYLLPLQWHMD